MRSLCVVGVMVAVVGCQSKAERHAEAVRNYEAELRELERLESDFEDFYKMVERDLLFCWGKDERGEEQFLLANGQKTMNETIKKSNEESEKEAEKLSQRIANLRAENLSREDSNSVRTELLREANEIRESAKQRTKEMEQRRDALPGILEIRYSKLEKIRKQREIAEAAEVRKDDFSH